VARQVDFTSRCEMLNKQTQSQSSKDVRASDDGSECTSKAEVIGLISGRNRVAVVLVGCITLTML